MSNPINPNKALWEKGDFTRIASTHERERRSAGCDARNHEGAQGAGPGLRRWDDGAAGGETRRGRDWASILREPGGGRKQARPGEGPYELPISGRRRVQSAGPEGQSFDLVVSIFGAMFAPKPFDVAKEMVRVTRPGGRIVMGNWIPNDPTLVAQILKISSAYSPPPPEGFISPMTWGVESHVIERFGAAGVAKEKISFLRDTYTFNYPGTPAELVRRSGSITGRR